MFTFLIPMEGENNRFIPVEIKDIAGHSVVLQADVYDTVRSVVKQANFKSPENSILHTFYQKSKLNPDLTLEYHKIQPQSIIVVCYKKKKRLPQLPFNRRPYCSPMRDSFKDERARIADLESSIIEIPRPDIRVVLSRYNPNFNAFSLADHHETQIPVSKCISEAPLPICYEFDHDDYRNEYDIMTILSPLNPLRRGPTLKDPTTPNFQE